MLLTVKDAGELLGLKPNAVYNLIHTGELRAVNVAPKGRSRPRLRIRRDDLQAFVDARTHDPLSAPTQALDAAL